MSLGERDWENGERKKEDCVTFGWRKEPGPLLLEKREGTLGESLPQERGKDPHESILMEEKQVACLGKKNC